MLVFVGVLGVMGQGTTGAILGVVRDQTGAVLPGTSMQVTHQETGRARTVVTDSGGRYRVPALELGTYTVQATLAGFRSVVRTGVSLTVGMEAEVNLAMEVGAVTESVTVAADAGLVQTTSAQLSGLVGDQEIRDLPLNGRSYDALVFLQPGVSLMNNIDRQVHTHVLNGAGPKISVAGTSFDMTAFLLDGTDIHDHTNFGSGSAAGTNLGVDSILEFSVLTQNYGAQHGRVAGGIINAVTRGGSNALHGGAFEFLRNNVFDAREFFDRGDAPPFRRNQFGAFLGGPIVPNRTFFFVNYEGLRERKSDSRISGVPDLDARRGIIPGISTAGNPIPIAPTVVTYLNLYPLSSPGGRNFGDGTAEFFWQFKRPTTEDYGSVRIDHQFSDNQYVFGRLTLDDAQRTGDREFPQWTIPTTSRSIFSTLEHKAILSSVMLNVARFAFNRTSPFAGTGSTLPNDDELTFVPGRPWRLTFTADPSQSGAPVSQLGHATIVPVRLPQNIFQLSDDLDWQKGAHALKMGVNFERIQNNIFQSPRMGEFVFEDLASFLRGRPNNFLSGAIVDPRVTTAMRMSMIGLYFQDDLRASNSLTLNLGLRYEFITCPTEVFGNQGRITVDLYQASPANAPTTGVCPLGDNSSKRNLAPRFGFAWKLLGGERAVLRGGLGVYHNQFMGRMLYATGVIGGATNIQARAPRDNAILAQFPRLPFAQLQVSGLPSEAGFDADVKTPTVYHWNLTTEYQLPADMVLRLGYSGSHGLHLARPTEWNTAVPTFLADGTPFFAVGAPLKNPRYVSIGNFRTDANANYNSLQINFVKRFSRGLRFQTSYTWSKSITESGPFQAPQSTGTPSGSLIEFDRTADRSLANTDRGRVFTTNYTYAFPGNSLTGVSGAVLKGWEMSGIVSIQDGLPFTIVENFNPSRNGVRGTIQRPNLLPGFSNNPISGVTAGCAGVAAGQKLGTPDLYYDPCAFQAQAAGFYGNLGRNTVIGPGVATFSFSLVKNFRLNENNNLAFRAELFNVLNRPNFGLPIKEALNPSGRSGNAGNIRELSSNARQIQFGLRYTF
ncbi:MAG: hypothetical protein A3J28_09140 [Acidobacteria bacterium RIFCSPLOWO2_12_FULL_60_22]|nr:MAG: hypothetical protein A3J28_09140 [Acidobacteria bacterium RIFCSPLOWO2_12_FULL_60_22]